MQCSGLSDDGDLSITSWRDNFVTEFECDLPVAWTVCAQGGCMQVHAGASCRRVGSRLLLRNASCARWQSVRVRAGTLLDVL